MLNRKIRRPRRAWVLVPAAVALCAAAAALTGAVPARAASQPASGPTVRAVVAQVSRLQALPAGIKPAATLPKDCPSYDRTHECWVDDLTFVFKQDGKQVGTLKAVLEQDMTLKANSGKWSEEDVVLSATPKGITAPVQFKLFAACGLYCGAEANFSGLDMAAGDTGSLSYSATVPKGAMFTASSIYVLFYSALPFIPANVGFWDSLQPYRCDNGVAARGTGCVVPAYTPTFDLPRHEYGAAAAMIQWAQQNLDGHWGLESADKPLTRLNNPDEPTPTDNRKVICDTDWTAFPPWEAGSVTMKDSCDEFPFAATYQSGALNGVTTGAACAQVEAVKTSDRGTDPAELWNDVKVIGTYNRAAKCVRGHIPSKLNTSVGPAYSTFIRTQRLIDEDKFWLAVTT